MNSLVSLVNLGLLTDSTSSALFSFIVTLAADPLEGILQGDDCYGDEVVFEQMFRSL